MRKAYLFLLTAMLMLSVGLKAQKIILTEGFEEGIPSTWTQENVAGEQMWAVESDGTYPVGAYNGSKRAFLRNDKGQTLGYKTRLVTPVMNLAGVYQPIVKFAYAQGKWTSDVDTLRVYYKNEEKSDWSLLLEFAAAQEEWKTVMTDLPAVSSSYQLAFEGSDNLGRGIVLDDILVRSKPECTVPHDLYVTNMGDYAVTLGWQASLDANYFHIVLTESDVTGIVGTIDPDTLDRIDSKAIAFNVRMEADSTTYRLQGVEPGTYYHMYVRSLCDAENSEWGEFFFRMNAAVSLPYEENFNEDYTGTVSQLNAWTYSNNLPGMKVPFISTNIAPGVDLQDYSPDASICMMFTGASNATTALAAGKYAYAASPELLGADLKDCQVRFFGGVGVYTGLRNNACGIIVGVMTNPEDLTTFVAIDTCRVWGNREFTEFCVSLDKYTGNGKYVCFLSDFDMPNHFYVDNMVIEVRPALQRVYEIEVAPKDTEAAINWKGNASSYELMVTKQAVKNFDNIAAADVVIRTMVTGNNYTVTNLEAFHSWNRPYYAYVRATNGTQTSDWSSPKIFVTTAAATEFPLLFAFEDDPNVYNISRVGKCPGNINIFGNNASADHKYPYLTATNTYKGLAALTASNMLGCDEWVTLPRIAETDMRSLLMTFYLSGSSYYSSTNIAVGVMTNPMDLSTFTEVARYTCTSDNYIRCYADLSDTNLNGKGEYIAFVWKDNQRGQNVAYIDNITLDPGAQCIPVKSISATVSDRSAIVTWEKGATAWDVLLADAFLNDDVMEGTGLEENEHVIYTKQVLNNPVDTILSGLEPAHTYFYYVRTVCENGEKAIWSTPYTIDTDCPHTISIPFTETFSNYGSGTSAYPRCWAGDYEWSYSTTGYRWPYVYASYDHTGDHIGSAYLYSSSSVHSCIASPEIEGDMSKMRVSFYYYGSSSGYVMYAGVMSDPDDFGTFVALDTFRTAANVWKQGNLDLSMYKGTARRIAFASNTNGAASVYLDDISLLEMSCLRPFRLKAENVTENSLTFVWSGLTTDKFEVYVTNREMHLMNEVLETVPEDALVAHELVTENSLFVDNLETYTNYYFYVRPTCGEQLWASMQARTECFVINPKNNYREDFDGYVSGAKPECWTVGNGNKNTTSTYIPSVSTAAGGAYSSPNVLKFYSSVVSGTDNTPAYAAAPKILTADISKVSVSFSACYTNACYLIFGMMADPTDLSTFVVIDSISLTGTPMLYSYNLGDYKNIIGNAAYVAWRTPIGVAGQTVYLDDVMISGSTCPLPNPSVSQVSATSATVSSGLRVSSPWRMLVSTAELLLDSLDSDSYRANKMDTIVKDITSEASARRVVLTDLAENTDYYCYLSTLCGEDESSMWVSESFSTVCQPIALESFGTVGFEPEEGFRAAYDEGGLDMVCWIKGSKNTKNSAYEPSLNQTASYVHSGTRAMALSSSEEYNGAYIIAPAVDVDDISRLQVSFYGTGGSLIVGVVTDPNDMATFEAVDTVHAEKGIYSHFVVSLASYEGDYMGEKGKYVAFLSEFPGSNSFYIDDVSLELIPSCHTPLYAKLDSVSETEAIISWQGDGSQYRVVLSKDYITPAACATYEDFVVDTLVEGLTCKISHLAGGTQYFAYVQGICGEGNGSPFSTEKVIVHTECPESRPVPYFCDFDHNTAQGTGVRPDCWIGWVSNNAKQTYPQVIYNAGKGDSYGMEILSNSATRSQCYAVAPDLQIETLANYVVGFHARKASNDADNVGALVIGVITNPEEIEATFLPLDTLFVNSTNFHKYYVDMSRYAASMGMATRFALMTDYRINNGVYDDIYIDNFSIAAPVSCFEPEVEVTSVSETAANLHLWLPIEMTGPWQVVVMKADEMTDTADFDALAAKGQLINTDKTDVTVSSLIPGTQYVALARTMCGATDGNSIASEPLNFCTAFNYADSYFFGFEKNEGWTYARNSQVETFYLHPALVSGKKDGDIYAEYSKYPYAIQNAGNCVYAHTGEGALCMHATDNENGGYIVFPALTENKDRSFTFDIRPSYAGRLSNKLVNSCAKASFVIGLIEVGKGYETFQPLVSENMPEYSTLIEANVSNNYMFTHYIVNFTADQIRDKQIVLMNTSRAAADLYLDNVRMGEKSAWSTPLISSLLFGDTYADLQWINPDAMNIYIMKGRGTELDKAATVVSFTNVTGGSKHITGLNTETDYTIYLEAAGAPAAANGQTTAHRSFTTACAAAQLNANSEIVFNFDDNIYQRFPGSPSTDSLYWAPECWTIGTTGTYTGGLYYPLIQFPGRAYTSTPTVNTTQYMPGRNSSNSLRMNITNNAGALTPYIIMPLINAGLDSMQLEFYMRTFVEDAGTRKVITNNYIGQSTNEVIVGTVTDPEDFTTFMPIDTILYPYGEGFSATTDVTSDPDHLDYWYKAIVPLAGVAGNYIGFAYPNNNSLVMIDDVTLTPRKGILPPSGLKEVLVGTRTTDVAWTHIWQPDMKIVVCLYADDGITPVQKDTLDPGVNKYTFKNLALSTKYYWTVKHIGDGVESKETPKRTFTTECETIDINYKTSFEASDGYQIIQGTTLTKVACWTFTNRGTNMTPAATWPCNNGPEVAHSGDNGVRIYRSAKTVIGTIVSPMLVDVAAMDTMQVEFWARPAKHDPTTGLITTANNTLLNAVDLEIGTCTDPNDASTYVPMQQVTYSLSGLAKGAVVNEANDYLFQRYIIPLKGAVGPYVYITVPDKSLAGKSISREDIYVDDFKFSRFVQCPTPDKPVQTGESIESVSLQWESMVGSYNVQLATDPDFTATSIVGDTSVTGESCTFTGLLPDTKYYCRVQAACSATDISEWSLSGIAYTSIQPAYLEDFRAGVANNRWTAGSIKAQDVFDGAPMENTSVVGSYGWRRISESAGLQGAHMCSPFYTSQSSSITMYNYFWYMSPSLFIPVTGKTIHLTFEYALTQSTDATIVDKAPTAANMNDEQVFMVVISEDGGLTWKRENATVWSNGTVYGNADYTLSSIPSRDGQMVMDLTKYEGKYIKVGFYRESTKNLLKSSAIHIGRVRINYFEELKDEQTHCQYEDAYALNRFFISGDDAPAGTTVMTDYYFATETEMKQTTAVVADTVYTFTAHYDEAANTIIGDTVCEGTTYSAPGFFDHDKAGRYRMKLTSAVTGCDSIVTLRLGVTPAARYNEEATLCPGETYTWNGKILNRSGIYRDTTTSLVTGCDSISSLVLTYLNAGDTITKEVTITEDDLPYTYESITYPVGTKPGVYTDTIYVQSGECKGVLIHKLTINVGADLEQIIDMNALQSGVHKLLIREQLYIVRDGEWYDALGKSVNCPL